MNDTTIYYQLAYAETTGNEAFKCGARCLTGVAGVNLINDGLLGTGAKALQLIPSAEGVCLLQGVEFLATTTDVFCHLFVDGGYWKLEGYGGEDGFICSANCLTGLDTNSAEITEFPLLSGQGTVSQTLMLADEYICAPNHARYILAGAEYCRVVQELVVGLIGTYWVLQKGSMQDAFACGAHCFRRDVFTFL